MPRYKLTIPIYAFLEIEVDAEDEDAAYEAKIPDNAVYADFSGGLAVQHGSRLTISSDKYNTEDLEVEAI